MARERAMNLRHIVITGGAGFVAQQLTRALRQHYPDARLTLVDIVPPPADDAHITSIVADLGDPASAAQCLRSDVDAVVHLAAIVSSHAEADPDAGYRLNVGATQHLLAAAKNHNPQMRFLLASSLAVYGGDLPPVIGDDTIVTPQSSYGTQKAMAELLLNDYTRHGFVDGLALRLPTVCIRPGRPNRAASSFVSSIMREPLRGERAILPVAPDLPLWLTGTRTVVANLLHALTLPALPRDAWHVLNLPGFTVRVAEMIDALAAIRGDEVRALITEEFDPAIAAIVARWASKIDDQRAIAFGFQRDASFAAVLAEYLTDHST